MKRDKSAFVELIQGTSKAKHERIIAGHCTCNGDVETLPEMVEDKCYDVEDCADVVEKCPQ